MSLKHFVKVWLIDINTHISMEKKEKSMERAFSSTTPEF